MGAVKSLHVPSISTRLRSALPYALLHLGFTEFDTIHMHSFHVQCTIIHESAALTKHELGGHFYSIVAARFCYQLASEKSCRRRSTVEAVFLPYGACNLLIYINIPKK